MGWIGALCLIVALVLFYNMMIFSGIAVIAVGMIVTIPLRQAWSTYGHHAHNRGWDDIFNMSGQRSGKEDGDSNRVD